MKTRSLKAELLYAMIIQFHRLLNNSATAAAVGQE
jgi:hypothetical protein